MSTISERICKAIKDAGLSYGELSQLTGIPKSAIHRYATGQTGKCPIERIEAIAIATGVSSSYLMGWDDVSEPETAKGVRIPVLGNVAAGIPISAVEDIIDYEEIPEALARSGEFFGLRIKGNSMEPKISEGDIVIVRRQSDVESGQVAIIRINGDDATCKKLVKHENGLSLVSYNPAHAPMFFTRDEVVRKPVEIIGRVVELRAKF